MKFFEGETVINHKKWNMENSGKMKPNTNHSPQITWAWYRFASIFFFRRSFYVLPIWLLILLPVFVKSKNLVFYFQCFFFHFLSIKWMRNWITCEFVVYYHFRKNDFGSFRVIYGQFFFKWSASRVLDSKLNWFVTNNSRKTYEL